MYRASLTFLSGAACSALLCFLLQPRNVNDTQQETSSHSIQKKDGKRVRNRLFTDKAQTTISQLDSLTKNSNIDINRLSSHDPIERGALEKSLRNLAKSSPEKALQEVDGLTNDTDRQFAYQILCEELAMNAPHLIIDKLHSEGVDRNNEDLMLTFVAEYAKADPAATIEFVNSLDYHYRDEATGALLTNWAEIDPKAALNHGLKQILRDSVRGAMATIGRKMALSDPEQAVIDSLELKGNYYHKQIYLGSLFDEWSQNDPEAAIKAMAHIEKDPRANNNIYQAVGTNVANKPELGVEWLPTIQSERERKRATRYFASAWASKDPDAAIEWAISLKDSTMYDQAAWSLTQNYLEKDIQYAMEWSSSIEAEQLRKRNMWHVYTGWKQKDGEAANQWINTTDSIDQETKDRWMMSYP